MSTTSPLLSLVIPTYNETENILKTLVDVDQSLAGIPHEIIVVDDDSPDQTWKRAQEYARNHSGIRVYRRTTDRGLSAAVLEGFDLAKGDILGVMDADGSHDEKILPLLYQKISEGAELAVGSRRVPGGGATKWPWFRRGMSSFATWLSHQVIPGVISDTMSGYFLVTRPYLTACRKRLHPKGYKILLEVIARGRASRVSEVPYLFKDRRQGYSKLSSKVVVQFLQQLFILRFDEAAQKLRRAYHTGRYKKVRAWLGDGELLDIGCGQPTETMPDGAFLQFMGHGTGVDIKLCVGNFRFVQADIHKLPFPDGTFDHVTAMEVLEHVPDSSEALTEIARVLKPNGTVVVSFPSESWLWELIWSCWEKSFGFLWNDTHTHAQAPTEWEKLFPEKFTVLARRRHWRFDLLFFLRKK